MPWQDEIPRIVHEEIERFNHERSPFAELIDVDSEKILTLINHIVEESRIFDIIVIERVFHRVIEADRQWIAKVRADPELLREVLNGIRETLNDPMDS